MSSLYLHIPYCKKLCYYCDFHFSLNLKTKADFVAALCKELELQHNFLNDTALDTIYFGGGTPSVLSPDEIQYIFATIRRFWNISPTAEITFECNPDDLNLPFCKELYSLGINRLSIGIQSFFDDELHMLNRRHTAYEAQQSVHNAQQAGFSNITIDLMYGLPHQTLERWKQNLDRVSQLNVQHLSCYALTVEKNTALAQSVKRKQVIPQSDDVYIQQYNYLIQWCEQHGFEQYEISNFAKRGMYSRHNSNYWSGKSYLGVGPSAHSFNGTYRFWNTAHNQKYIDTLQNNQLLQESEQLSHSNICNEYIMTTLRTIQGIEIQRVQQLMTSEEFDSFLKQVQTLIQSEKLCMSASHIYCTSQGFMVSDMIIAELFV
ncbi:MAG: Oxygen-independent coproporphyrinogen-III oxidase 1 [Bacteroidetes bacterium ADurb.Bin217]|nr:MAG: Oxygen-independent coproporphyrinogen-III oxidase 1 [Bacteroidetes bacterium ADurb.Bin217]